MTTLILPALAAALLTSSIAWGAEVSLPRAPAPQAESIRSFGAGGAPHQPNNREAAAGGFEVFEYAPDRAFPIVAAPGHLTAIKLRPGERLVSKAAGDTDRWMMGETSEGTGSETQVVLLLKPLTEGIGTNIVVTTDERTYVLDARSSLPAKASSVVSWNYPLEDLLHGRTNPPRPSAPSPDLSADPARLNFSYEISHPSQQRAPEWQPLQVYDDGLRTYVKFPRKFGSGEAPPLFLVGDNGRAELVNYHVRSDCYVLDRLIEVAELRLGENKQRVVRIRRLDGGS